MAVLALSLPLALLACNKNDPIQRASSQVGVARTGPTPEAIPHEDSVASRGEAGPAGGVDTPPAELAGSALACSTADVELTGARLKEYSRLVAGAMDDKVKPKAVGVVRFMGVGTWSAVFATTPLADPGWFVFELVDGNVQFKSAWGGVAFEEDRPGVITWAADLGAPSDFAECFAQVAIH